MEPTGSDLPARIFPALVRHFFGRFFDKESLSPEGEPEAGVVQTLGILAAPGAFFVLLFRPLDFTGWNLVAVRFLFVTFSMIVMGFIMVFEWDALFPDRRDYQILTPQPLRLTTLFLARTTALALFLAIFLADVNFFGTLFWPGIDARPNTLAVIGSHMIAVLAGGLFAALAMAAIQGVLVTILRGDLYRRVSVGLQTLLMALLVMLLFLSPLAGSRMQWLAEHRPGYLYLFPGYWFTGFYETLLPATRSLVLRDLGGFAVRALGWVGAIFVLTYLPGYRGHSRRALESPRPDAAGPGPLRRWVSRVLERTVLRHPVERGVYRFITQTITRSLKHRLFLAVYGGFGAAMTVVSLAAGRAGLFDLPFMLSFILISGLRAAFNFPSELAANWAFQLTETRGITPYLEATRKWIVIGGVLPLFLLLLPMEAARFAWPIALFHTAFGVTVSIVLVELMFLGFRKAPFTCAHFPGKVNLVLLGVIYVFGFTTYSGTMARLEAFLERRPASALVFFVLAAATRYAMAHLGRRVLGPQAVLDYDDPADPVVRTLGIATR
jgi:hypothetical protein